MLSAIIVAFTKIVFLGSQLWLSKKLMRLWVKASFQQSERFNMLKKCFQNSVYEKLSYTDIVTGIKI